MTDQHNEAEEMREGYARRQEHEREGAPTSAGGAGSTSTPGNSETGGESSDTPSGRSGGTGKET